ncbi:MAG: M48 family metalloprotease, partial [Alphaproteobacteria bacterium]|nr:M48 family metalloprotease [Alphaproteobacteria bacterium]
MPIRGFIARVLIASVIVGSMPSPGLASHGGTRLRLIRDAEIERTIREFAKPVFATAGMSVDQVKVYLIRDNRLNAFVAGGRNIFLNTGLLVRAKSAEQVIGVIAHETGHIVGGHLIRMRNAIREAQIKQIIAFLLGAAAAVAARDARAGAATIGLGAKVAEGTFLKYSRSNERAADQFAVTALNRAGISSRGMLEFMKIIQNQELLITANQDPYIRTHPITSARIDFLREQVARSPFSNSRLPARYTEMHERMRAKLIGFLSPPSTVFGTYQPDDDSLPSRYARAIAHHRQAETAEALKLIDGLIKERPRDPYFHELKGQILFESGRAVEAVVSLRASVKLAPGEALLRMALGQALLALGPERTTRAALAHLRVAVRSDNSLPLAWRLLGIAHGKLGQIGLASLALAEYGLLIGDKKQVYGNIGRAERYLKKGTPSWFRIQDLKREMERREK